MKNIEKLHDELKEIYNKNSKLEIQIISQKTKIKKLQFQLQEEKSINSMLSKKIKGEVLAKEHFKKQRNKSLIEINKCVD